MSTQRRMKGNWLPTTCSVGCIILQNLWTFLQVDCQCKFRLLVYYTHPAELADVWLRASLTEISADVWEAVAN